ncbi:MAG: YqcI/YcgG family protein [Candidatus Eremiobacteraeota bacterium]|nr:YqcI/YcgG family protein [Candidatus Eremiobacteraeota bacterium]
MLDSLDICNPYGSHASFENSEYFAPGAHSCEVDEAFRAFVNDDHFACLGAKASVATGKYRLGMYGKLGTAASTAGLSRDMFTFSQEQDRMQSDFTTFVAIFLSSRPASVLSFERALWKQLQRLHDEDRLHHAWDPRVSADPQDRKFSFSFNGKAFFVVGLHPLSPRKSRRFRWPALVFNAHHQFDNLRSKGQFDRLRDTIRRRELLLQGNINAEVADFGERSEARQYSGRRTEDAWRCPFKPRDHPS